MQALWKWNPSREVQDTGALHSEDDHSAYFDVSGLFIRHVHVPIHAYVHIACSAVDWPTSMYCTCMYESFHHSQELEELNLMNMQPQLTLYYVPCLAVSPGTLWTRQQVYKSRPYCRTFHSLKSFSMLAWYFRSTIQWEIWQGFQFGCMTINH